MIASRALRAAAHRLAARLAVAGHVHSARALVARNPGRVVIIEVNRTQPCIADRKRVDGGDGGGS